MMHTDQPANSSIYIGITSVEREKGKYTIWQCEKIVETIDHL
jgi:hypothetical protein